MALMIARYSLLREFLCRVGSTFQIRMLGFPFSLSPESRFSTFSLLPMSEASCHFILKFWFSCSISMVNRKSHSSNIVLSAGFLLSVSGKPSILCSVGTGCIPFHQRFWQRTYPSEPYYRVIDVVLINSFLQEEPPDLSSIQRFYIFLVSYVCVRLYG